MRPCDVSSVLSHLAILNLVLTRVIACLFSPESMAMLEADLEESERKLRAANDSLESAFPISEISKERRGNTGAKSWGHMIWELIIEQLVNGTPPSAVNKNIVIHVRRFSPQCVIRELPSIWTIRRARSVLLVIVQTLAAYRLGRANKWGQVFTDGSARRQESFQNLVISIEEDELFK